MHGRHALALVVFLLPLSPAFAAQDGDDPPSRTLRAAPAEAVRVDGVLDEAAWTEAEPATGFVQFEPTEGAPATQPTEVRVLYGSDALYVGATLFDAEPDRIRAVLSRRDHTGDADGFVVGLDTYNDRKTAALFGVTAAGVQFDAILTDNGDDDSWDAVWSSSVRITPEGWVVEMAIPYSQLRFTEGVTSWGINFQRQLRREGEETFWAPFTREQASSGIVQYFGRLEGLPGLSTRRPIQLAPYSLARANTFEDAEVPGTMASDLGADVGADLKIGLASNVILDATINPDFGQVEADPAQLNLTTFETFFPERRPFFLEGTSIFDYTIGSGDGSLLYTRRIGGAAPIVGATKLSGRLPSGLSFGVLGAATGDDFDPDRWYGVGRLKQEFGSQNYVGAAVTAFRSPAESGAGVTALAAGADWDVRLGADDGWKLEGSLAGSVLDDLSADAGDPARGYALYVGFDRVKGFLTPDSGFRIYSDDFEINEVGRFRQNDLVSARLGAGYLVNEGNPVGPFRRLETWGGGTQVWRYADGTNRGFGFFSGLYGELLGFQSLNLNVSGSGLGGYDVRETRGLGPVANVATVFAGLYFETDQRKQLTFWTFTGGGLGEDGGRQYDLGTGVDWTASDRVRLSLDLNFGAGDDWQAWAANEGFVRTPDGLAIGTATAEPGAFASADDLFFLDVADPDGLLDGVPVWDDALAIPDATGYYVPVFGRRDVRQASVSTRANVIFRPNLSLQLYGQVFAARGRYDRFQLLAIPDELRDFDAYPKRRDFAFESFQTNAVLRWEYRPGSTLFVVWSQSRNNGISEALLLDPDGLPPTSSPFETGTVGQLGDVFELYPDNVFLVKLSYLLMR